jgi:hypothetical protein
MPKLTFYPIGNADCCLIELADGQRMLFDYANVRDEDDDDDLRIDLAAAVRDDLNATTVQAVEQRRPTRKLTQLAQLCARTVASAVCRVAVRSHLERV